MRQPTTGIILIRTHQFFNFLTIPINGRFSALQLSCLVQTSTAVSRDYTCLMSPNKDESGRMLSRIPFFFFCEVQYFKLLKVISIQVYREHRFFVVKKVIVQFWSLLLDFLIQHISNSAFKTCFKALERLRVKALKNL